MLSQSGGIVLVLALAGMCQAEDSAQRPANILTNRDIVTLAGAGYDEESLIDFIAQSRKHFDTTPDALAALSKQGIKPRVLAAMAAPEKERPEAVTSHRLPRAAKPSPAILALEKNKSYHESKSVFWGLWTRTVTVAPQPEESTAGQYGAGR